MVFSYAKNCVVFFQRPASFSEIHRNQIWQAKILKEVGGGFQGMQGKSHLHDRGGAGGSNPHARKLASMKNSQSPAAATAAAAAAVAVTGPKESSFVGAIFSKPPFLL